MLPAKCLWSKLQVRPVLILPRASSLPQTSPKSSQPVPGHSTMICSLRSPKVSHAPSSLSSSLTSHQSTGLDTCSLTALTESYSTIAQRSSCTPTSSTLTMSRGQRSSQSAAVTKVKLPRVWLIKSLNSTFSATLSQSIRKWCFYSTLRAIWMETRSLSQSSSLSLKRMHHRDKT